MWFFYLSKIRQLPQLYCMLTDSVTGLVPCMKRTDTATEENNYNRKPPSRQHFCERENPRQVWPRLVAVLLPADSYYSVRWKGELPLSNDTTSPPLQCCGSEMFIPDLNFSHPGSDFFHPGSEFFPSRIPDPHKIFKYFNPKNCF